MSSTFFTAHDGDIILRTSLGPDLQQDFQVHKLILSLASPVFKDLFQVAQPDGGQGGLPIITITDSTESVDLLLRFIYPGLVPPTITDLSVLSALLAIADKYAVTTVSLILKQRLATEDLLEKDPFGVYTVARRWGLTDEAKAAARGLTLMKIMKSPSSKNPQNLVVEDFFRLLWFTKKRGEEGKTLIRRFFTWETDPLPTMEIPCGNRLHSGMEAQEFYRSLAEKIAEEFDVNPCLDMDLMARIFVNGPDPPSEGFCEPEEIDLHQVQEPDFHVFCPTRPSRIVQSLIHLASSLEYDCELYLRKALDGEFPT
ncbi:hypothetical protein BDM02DRAFT_3113808 [Thelephora ganbajun]|uniref:Uncharacterized protein n=1 Tax=Thelephora ganbajun TaxID=370292 RepID=A0ACB6ZIJ7_THEGA|nr:hypothetical protein BDM02DRAFT_3113808 [Thelephora ganbajun]